jgi:hypothetical protein
MPGHSRPLPPPESSVPPTSEAACSPPPTVLKWTAEQLQRWAELIAAGGEQFPVGLATAERDWLVSQVRQRRRDRLIHFLAAAIAWDLRGGAQPPRRETC